MERLAERLAIAFLAGPWEASLLRARAEQVVAKAILHNCAMNGPHAQNHDGHADFRAHLAGMVSYAEMLNPARGQRLRAIFERIRW